MRACRGEHLRGDAWFCGAMWLCTAMSMERDGMRRVEFTSLGMQPQIEQNVSEKGVDKRQKKGFNALHNGTHSAFLY